MAFGETRDRGVRIHHTGNSALNVNFNVCGCFAAREDLQAREQFQRDIDAGLLELDSFVRNGQSGVFLRVF